MAKAKILTLQERERRAGIRVPVHDEHMERGVLGSMILCRPEVDTIYPVITRSITKDYFYKLRHQEIFEAIMSLYEAVKPIDILMVEHELQERGELANIGGLDYLVDLFGVVPTTANVGHYSDALCKLYRRRMMTLFAEEGLRLTNEGEIDEAIARFQAASQEIDGVGRLLPATKQLEKLDAAFAEEVRTGIVGFATGFPQLDRALGGLVRGRSYVIAGRTSEGKTALTNQIGLVVAKADVPVHIFSREMSADDLYRRFISLESGVPLPPGALRKLSEEDREKVQHARKMFERIPIQIDDRPLTLAQTVAEARRLKGKVGLFIVDHARLVPVPGASSEYDQVTAVSGAAKRHLAIEANAAVILVAQVNREGAKSEGARLHHLQGSGALEQDADAVMLISRKAYNDPGNDSNEVDLALQKNRHHGCAVIDLKWNPQTMKFEEDPNRPKPTGKANNDPRMGPGRRQGSPYRQFRDS